MANSPVTLIFPGSTVSLGYIGCETASIGGSGEAFSPFTFNGALYWLAQSVGLIFDPNRIDVFKSTDGGLTWNRLDTANAPTTSTIPNPNGSGRLDVAASKLTICYNNADVGTPANEPVKLRDFSLLTETWGADYGTAGAPSTFSCNQLIKRSDGSLVFFRSRNVGASITGLVANVFAAGVWSADINVDANRPGGQTSNSSSSAVLDPATDIIHIFYQCKDGSNNNFVTYQQLKPDNTLGVHFNFTNEFAYLGVTSPNVLQAMGDPLIDNVHGNILWGVMDPVTGAPSILVGTPISNPVWSVLAAPGIDPGFTPVFSQTQQPTLTTDGTTLWGLFVYQLNSDGITHVRLASTSLATPLSGWTGGDAPIQVGTFPVFAGPQYPSFQFDAASNSLLLVVQADLGGGGDPTGWFSAIPLGSPPSRRRPVAPGFGGGGFGLSAAGRPVGRGGFGSAGCGCPPRVLLAEQLRRRLERVQAWPYVHLMPPAEAVPVEVYREGDGSAPADALELDYLVPSGCEFFLQAVLFDLVGAVSLAPGDATWRLGVNRSVANVQATRVQGLQNIGVPLGSVVNGTAWPFWQPYHFFSLDRVRANALRNSGTGGRFVLALFGYLMPAAPFGVS